MYRFVLRRMIQHNATQNQPSIFDYSCWVRNRSAIAGRLSVLFIVIVIIIATLIVCFTFNTRSKKSCESMFRRSVNPPVISRSTNSYPTNVAIGDFNEDDDLDLIVADSISSQVSIFFGYGNGSFTSQSKYSIGPNNYPYWTAVGDFNNDQHVDIVTANYGSNSIAVLLGDGHGILGDPIMTSLGPSRPLSLTVADLNNDHRMDLAVVSSSTANLIILHGFGNGSFRIESRHHMGYDSVPIAVAVNDFNNDNQLDFAVVNYGTSYLVILMSNDNQTFARYEYSTGIRSLPTSIAVADINNDSILDIAIINSGTKTVGIFYGYGNGIFRKQVTQSTGSNSSPWFVAISDLDDDQIPDMIVANTGSNLIIFKGDGNGIFSIMDTQKSEFNSTSYSIAVADFDRDNRTDVIVTNNDMKVLVLTSFVLQPTLTRISYSTGPDTTPYSLALADFNDDKEFDVVVCETMSKSLVMFIGFGNGSFSPAKTIIAFGNYSPILIAAGDFNTDKKNDIVMISSEQPHAIGILLQEDHDSFIFKDLHAIPNSLVLSSITVVDINNDHKHDIVITDSWMDNVQIFIGYGNGTFHNGIVFNTGWSSSPTGVAVADLNDDHLLDLVVVAGGYNQLLVHLGYVNGSFLESKIISTGDDRPLRVLIADLNKDHHLDIIFLSVRSSKIGVCLGYGNGTFGNITTYSTGESSYTYSFVVDDFNRDARLDIAFANYVVGIVGISLGYGDGTFTPFMIFATDNRLSSRCLASGDFNHDHIQDMVVINSIGGTMTVFLTNLTAIFKEQRNYLTDTHPEPLSIDIVDLNNDSRLDIVVLYSGQDTIQIFLNNDNQNFLHGAMISTGLNSRAQSMIIADFNQDNLFDIVTANSQDRSIRVFLGFGNGTFDEASRYSTGLSSPVSITSGNFNNDHWMDVVVAYQNADNIGIFLGFNYQVFSRYRIQTVEYSMPYYVVAADFNHDSYMDIVVAYRGRNFVHVYLAYGNGLFIRETELETHYFSNTMCVGDFNRDHHLDMALTAWGPPGIQIFLGMGDGTFATQIFYTMDAGSFPISIATDDLNSDGILDLVVAARDLDYILVTMGYGNGTFTDSMIYPMPNGSHPNWIVISDFNNDHIRDIAVANRDQNHIGILFGYGNGTFRDVTFYSTGNNSYPCSITVGDFNQDHSMDIAVANQFSRTIGVFLNHGNGTFASQITYFTGSKSVLGAINVGDLNNDSVLDIAFTDEDKADGNIGVFYGYADGTFVPAPKRYSTGYNAQPSSIAIHDLNNDGRLDVIVTNENIDIIDIMLGDRDEPFGGQTIFSTGANSQPIAVAVNDFNHDQHVDIAVANYQTNNIGIFLGYNNGTFAPQETFSTGISSRPYFISIADMNNDTHFDLIVANSGTDEICILIGYGNGNFILKHRYSTGERSTPHSVVVRDLNNDDHLDLIIALTAVNKMLIIFGQSNGSFSSFESQSLGYGAHPQSTAIGDLNNDHWLDIAVAEFDRNYIDIFYRICSHD